MRAPGNAAAKTLCRISRNASGLYPQNTVVVNVDTAASPVGRGGSRVPLNSCGGNLSLIEAFVAGLAIPVTPCEDAATLVLGRGVVQHGAASHGETTGVIDENAAAGVGSIALYGSVDEFKGGTLGVPTPSAGAGNQDTAANLSPVFSFSWLGARSVCYRRAIKG